MRNIDVLANDCGWGSQFRHTTNFSTSGEAARFYVINAPEDYPERHWFYSGTGSGTYDLGTFEINVTWGDVLYSGDYAYTTYTGSMTLNAEGRESITFDVSFNSITNRNYDSSEFLDTTSAISRTVESDIGTFHELSVFFETYTATGPFSLQGDIVSVGVDLLRISQPAYGVAEKISNSSVRYTPDPDTTEKKDEFTYTIATLLGESDTANVVIEAVQWVDLDVDSNNDGSITEEDDRVEREGLGKRIFRNSDDDGRDGFADYLSDSSTDEEDDFAKIELKVDIPDAEFGKLDGPVEVWLFVPDGLNLWADDIKGETDHVRTEKRDRHDGQPGKFYVWELSGRTLSKELRIEGVTAKGYLLSALLRQGKDGRNRGVTDSNGKNADDRVKLNVESIVFPSIDQRHEDWNSRPTSDWDGLEVGERWWISKSLEEYINDKRQGELATAQPRYTLDGAAAEIKEGPDSYSTEEFSDGFVLTFDFDFDRSRGGNGYVQIVPQGEADNVSKEVTKGGERKKLSAVANSGIKFGSYTRPTTTSDSGNAETGRSFEAAILDVDAWVDRAGGIDAVAGIIGDEGWVRHPDYQDEPLNRLMSGIEYAGEYENMSDFEPGVGGAVDQDDYLKALKNQLDRSRESGNKMKIDVSKIAGEASVYVVKIELNGASYERTVQFDGPIGKQAFQSHWGSGAGRLRHIR